MSESLKSLLVIYDSSIKSKGRDSYLKGIKKHIPTTTFIDVKDHTHYIEYKQDYVLVLKPMDRNKLFNISYDIRKSCPEKDIESITNGGFTITAQALWQTIFEREHENIESKTAVIINQSPTLGIPLAKHLIDWGVNVININSKYKDLDNLLAFTDIDILVSASGNYDFEIDRHLTRMINTKIDLSNDLEDPVKITHIPTIQVLAERLEK